MEFNENSLLFPKEKGQHKRRNYGGRDDIAYTSTEEYEYDNSAFSEKYEELENGGIEDSNSGRSVGETESASDILYRLRYGFLDPDLDSEHLISESQARLTGQDKLKFKEDILEGIREVPLPMRQKLRLRRILTTDHVNRRREQASKKYISSKSRKNNTVFFRLWESSITKLTAYFGSTVASYFTFLRTLFFLNLLTGLILFSFTGVPQITTGEFLLDQRENRNITFGHFGDLSYSMLFYGIYRDDVEGFNLPLSYFLTWISVNLLTVLYLASSMYVRYRRSKLSDTGSDFPFTWSTLCYFDFTINTKDGVKDHLKAFCTHLKEKIREEKSLEVVDCIKRLRMYFGRLVSNILVLGLLGGSGFLIYYVAEKETSQEEIELDDKPEDLVQKIYERYRLAVVVAFLKLFVPFIFELLVKIESYHPRTELKFTLARTTFFYYASLIVFIVSLTKKAECANVQNPQTSTTPGRRSPTTLPFTGTTGATSSPPTNASSLITYCCWENVVGEEIFKLILVDLGVCIAVGLLFHVVKAIFIKTRTCCCQINYSEFAVTSNVLDLVYGQGLVWLALYFSPLMALVATVKLFIVFYFRYFVARFANIPPKKMFRASRSGNFYLFLLLLTWMLCFIPVVYVLIEKTPSWYCGPFENKDRAYKVIDLFDSLNDLPSWLDWVKDAIDYIATAIVIVPIIVVLILLVLYYRVKSSSYNALIQELRKQLVFERKIERKKVYARALSAPAIGSVGKASGSAITGEMSRKTSISTITS
ncbi:transmembrane channel-like protein 3 [Saccostrea echinata]|uniref:transmembrane channel-like protein 3 n=1 Tax=Saccostrea echinata TaxID=191078 RepID=UPI002A8373A2|nr:transmembrane channel-like protein 3 [Saccostrea echinata]